jgi:hypothetical protein
MRDIPSCHQAPAANDRSQQAPAHIRQRLYGMKHLAECSCHPSAGPPVEILDSTSMETRPLRRR